MWNLAYLVEFYTGNQNGGAVVLSQTGVYLEAVGKLTITSKGVITTELLGGDDLTDLSPEPGVKAVEDAGIMEADSLLGEVIGSAEIVFDNYDSGGKRLVRKQSTNTGGFAADAFDISEWAVPAMQWACGAGLMEGDGVNLAPAASATRSQAAILLMRFCELEK